MSFFSKVWRFAYLILSYGSLGVLSNMSNGAMIALAIFVAGLTYDYHLLKESSGQDDEQLRIAKMGLKFSVPIFMFCLLTACGLFVFDYKTGIIYLTKNLIIPLPTDIQLNSKLSFPIGFPYWFIWFIGWVVPGIECSYIFKSFQRETASTVPENL